ncbi:purine-nucleoside phosphorylase [Bacteroidota bacterium]
MTPHHTLAKEFIKAKTGHNYPIGIILGTGLGGLVKYIDIDFSIEYSDIPHFPVSTVEFHSGKLIFGTLSGKRIVAMQGRFHYYEGYNHHRVTFPVHILKELGIRYLLVSNACGALNPQFKKTELIVISSHINLHFDTPLIGFKIVNHKAPAQFYSKELIKLAEDIAIENDIDIRKGVYASVQGPNLETRAEYRMIKKIGGDVVGMSTIPEVIVAHKLGIKCLGISIVTDEGFPDTLEVANIQNIIKAASVAEPNLTLLTQKLVEKL